MKFSLSVIALMMFASGCKSNAVKQEGEVPYNAIHEELVDDHGTPVPPPAWVTP